MNSASLKPKQSADVPRFGFSSAFLSGTSSLLIDGFSVLAAGKNIAFRLQFLLETDVCMQLGLGL